MLQDIVHQHEGAIEERQTRGLLRIAFREVVLEDSKQIKRKYSYSAASSGAADKIIESDSTMSKLKKLQRERLIVARLGFAEKACEIDGALYNTLSFSLHSKDAHCSISSCSSYR
jgi:hypothetical protein